MAAFQRWRSKIQGEMLPNFVKVLMGYVGTPRTCQDLEGPPRTPKEPKDPRGTDNWCLRLLKSVLLVGKVYSKESLKGENISHLSCAFKRKVA
jgi:hypothetical protein